jgi:hypothetical protein
MGRVTTASRRRGRRLAGAAPRLPRWFELSSCGARRPPCGPPHSPQRKWPEGHGRPTPGARRRASARPAVPPVTRGPRIGKHRHGPRPLRPLARGPAWLPRPLREELDERSIMAPVTAALRWLSTTLRRGRCPQQSGHPGRAVGGERPQFLLWPCTFGAGGSLMSRVRPSYSAFVWRLCSARHRHPVRNPNLILLRLASPKFGSSRARLAGQ